MVVIGLPLIGFGDMPVITQTVAQLRTVGLRVNRLQFNAANEGLQLGPLSLGLAVHALRAAPHTRHARERAQVGQRVRIGLGLGVDVGGERVSGVHGNASSRHG